MSFYESIGFLSVWLLVVCILIKILKYCLKQVRLSLGLSVKWHPDPHDWAIITGATDGIGLEFARQMAEKGYNLLLISRNQERLDSTATAIQETYSEVGEIRTVAFDFTSHDYSPIEAAIQELPRVHVLVNNVGLSYDHPEYFNQLRGWDFIENLIYINAISCTKMIYYVLPKMEKQNCGVIINLSSLSGVVPSPLLSVYSASKAYIDFLSRSLAIEYEDKGIIVQSIAPSYVVSKMSKIRRSSFAVPTPKTYVRSALSTVGLEISTSGYWAHSIERKLIQSLGDYGPKLIYKTLSNVRKMAYKKKEREQKSD